MTSLTERAISPTAAVGILAAIVLTTALLAQGQDAATYGRTLWRVGAGILALLILSAAAIDKARTWTAHRQHAAGMQRIEVYVIAVAVVLALLFVGQSLRYTITTHDVQGTTIYQRTDRLTGTAEVWAPVSGTPRPAWIQTAQ